MVHESKNSKKYKPIGRSPHMSSKSRKKNNFYLNLFKNNILKHKELRISSIKMFQTLHFTLGVFFMQLIIYDIFLDFDFERMSLRLNSFSSQFWYLFIDVKKTKAQDKKL